MVMITEKKDRLVYFDRGRQNSMQSVAPARVAVEGVSCSVMRQMAEDVFHHDDSAVDDDAEIDRTNRQQIGRIAPKDSDDNGKK